MSNSKQHLRDIIKANKMAMDEVNINEFIFRKILIGDSGDNVSPIDVKIKETTKGPRVFRVTDKQANDVLNEFKEARIFVNQSHLFNSDHINHICEIAKRVIKIEKPISEIREKWTLNRDLVFLHSECIPKEIGIAMFESVENTYNRTLAASNLHTIMDKDSILRGTSYTKEKKDSFSESGIFKTLEKKEEPKTEVVVKKETDETFDHDFWSNLTK
jgi:gamma-glutamyl phosphate reductase